jgi:pSer/pThr/pTyr-binding forkhead associated (FHA) protein
VLGRKLSQEAPAVPARQAEPDLSGEMEFDIALRPVSHADLGDILINGDLFSVGRNEPPFASYPRDAVADLSRRHAKIFTEGGAVYLADLGSKNGTTVNGIDLRQKTTQLKDGDEVCFGGRLCYQTQLRTRAATQLPPARLLSMTLTPEHADLGLQPIVVTHFPFLISKSDTVFAQYKEAFPHQVNYLSRRHAHVFLKGGMPHVEDLGSTNGSFVNGVRLEEHAVTLNHGDVLAFGGHHFVYRVGLQTEGLEDSRTVTKFIPSPRNESAEVALPLEARAVLPPKPASVFSQPAAARASAQPAQAEASQPAAPQKDAPPVSPLSAATPALAHPAALRAAPDSAAASAPIAANAAVGQAGSAQATAAAAGSPPPAVAAAKAAERDKTTFVAAADSFLDIFCADTSQPQDDEVNVEDAKPEQAAGEAQDRRERLLRNLKWSAAVAGIAIVGAVIVFFAVPERGLKDMVENGKYAEAASVANQRLARDPTNSEVKALATESLLKAYVPTWIDRVKARDFARADATISVMKTAGSSNPDLPPLALELSWVGNIEAFVLGRGGPDAPVRIYTDEERLKGILKSWDDGQQTHQQAFATLSSFVPAFNDVYADALSHLRKLQSDDAVTLPAMERLKVTIATGLDQDHPETLEPAVKEAAEKYSRIGDLDKVRSDVQNYLVMQQAVAAGALGSLVGLVEKTRFMTPPFQAKFKSLVANGRLPSGEVVTQYGAVAKLWRAGTAGEAFSGLEKMSAGGPWAGGAANELEHKKKILEQFNVLQKGRPANADDNYYARLLAFHGSLDPDEDVFFLKAASAGLAPYRERALRQAQENANRGQLAWARYREAGALTAAQRLESAVSEQFRSQARLLANAQHDAREGTRTYGDFKLEAPPQWKKTQDEINAEIDAQRKALLDLRNVLEPALLKSKLALLGGESDEGRKPSKTAR